MPAPEKNESFESWIWNAACSIRGAKDALKYSREERDRLPEAARRVDTEAFVNDYILPLIFTKRLAEGGARAVATNLLAKLQK